MAINYNQKLNELLKSFDINNKPNLFLHICCAPCSSYVLEKLYDYFNIYIIFYNPNIDTKEEFDHRLSEFHKFISVKNYDVKILYEDHDHNEFLNNIHGLEKAPEGGDRCKICFKLRLQKAYEIAQKYINENKLIENKNFLCTSLSISPHKDADALMIIGEDICSGSAITYLPSDFKKENGYLRSIELSKKYGLYRQDYCGCEFAKSHIY